MFLLKYHMKQLLNKFDNKADSQAHNYRYPGIVTVPVPRFAFLIYASIAED